MSAFVGTPINLATAPSNSVGPAGAGGLTLPSIGFGGFNIGLGGIGSSSGSSAMIRTRSLDIIIPDCAIQEHHRDRLTITNHPVEMGAPITDHAFKEPVEVSLQYGWANSSGGSESYVADIYKKLQNLQTERRPFSITTGKRKYSNMLIAELSVTTDPTSEYILMAQITCREVILVQLTTVSNKTDQKSPEKTETSTSKGDKKATPSGESNDGRQASLLHGNQPGGDGTDSGQGVPLTATQMYGNEGDLPSRSPSEILGNAGELPARSPSEILGNAGELPTRSPQSMYGGSSPATSPQTPPVPTPSQAPQMPTGGDRPSFPDTNNYIYGGT